MVTKCGLPFEGPFLPHPFLWLSFKNLYSSVIVIHEHKILGLVLKDEPDFLEKFKTWKRKEPQNQIFFASFSKLAMIFSWKRMLQLKGKFFSIKGRQPFLGHYEKCLGRQVWPTAHISSNRHLSFWQIHGSHWWVTYQRNTSKTWEIYTDLKKEA